MLENQFFPVTCNGNAVEVEGAIDGVEAAGASNEDEVAAAKVFGICVVAEAAGCGLWLKMFGIQLVFPVT